MFAGQANVANHVGCTACVALITATEIYVANSGDSRAVLSKKGVAVEMSRDHKPDLPTEKKRIEKAGGFVEDGRVNGILNLSRSLGDMEYKNNSLLKAEEQMITANPEVKVEKLGGDAEFLVIACDGIWDCMSSQDAVDFINEKTSRKTYKYKISAAIENMFDQIIATDIGSSGGVGCDNMTCVVVQFKSKK